MPSDVITSISQVRDRVTRARRANQRIGLVPTMGALHEGHKRLIDLARAECDLVVVSIFVNPLQFDREDDLNNYPRTLESDVDICSASHVDVVFTPSVDEMYPSPLECAVDVGRIADHLCGRFRPGHFRGVATVILKLFQIAQPDRAYFGEKDAQQVALIRRLVADFNVPVDVVAVPTVREADGLAVSSRNKRLKPNERQIATVLFDALRAAKSHIEAGMRDSPAVREAAERVIQKQEGVRLEYLEIVDPRDMQPVARIERPVVVAGAIWVGATRLIDNVICIPR